MGEWVPSESEWLIMEMIWEADRPVTAAEIIEQRQEQLKVSAKTIRVMLNRLLAKGVIDYSIDEKDSRIYHYYAVRSLQECLAEKKSRFVKNYFGGNQALAVASFLETTELTKEQLEELQILVQDLKDRE